MQLELNDAEYSLLLPTLTNYLGDLRMEIGATDNRSFRSSLKEDEETLKRLIQKLESLPSQPATATR